jgi:hypothetical protein
MSKKPYIKPVVNKVEIDSDIMRMWTKQGFIDLWWERFQEAKKIDPCVTQEAIFDQMNEEWSAVIGSTRYSSYDTFRRRKDS